MIPQYDFHRKFQSLDKCALIEVYNISAERGHSFRDNADGNLVWNSCIRIDALPPKQRNNFSNHAVTDGIQLNLFLDVPANELSSDDESIDDEEFDRFVVDEEELGCRAWMSPKIARLSFQQLRRKQRALRLICNEISQGE